MIISDEDIGIGEVEAELSDRHIDSIGYLCKGSPVQLASSEKSTDVLRQGDESLFSSVMHLLWQLT